MTLNTVIAIDAQLIKLGHRKRILMSSALIFVVLDFECLHATLSLSELVVSIGFENAVELSCIYVCASIWRMIMTHITLRNLNGTADWQIVALTDIPSCHREVFLMVAMSLFIFLRDLLERLNAVLVEPIYWILSASLVCGRWDRWKVFRIKHA
jgi:hypothetical protein